MGGSPLAKDMLRMMVTLPLETCLDRVMQNRISQQRMCPAQPPAIHMKHLVRPIDTKVLNSDWNSQGDPRLIGHIHKQQGGKSGWRVPGDRLTNGGNQQRIL